MSRSTLRGRAGHLVGRFGCAMTCDGTDRYQRAVVNWLVCLPDCTNACFDVSVTGGEKKTKEWWAKEVADKVEGPLNPHRAGRCILCNLDGGMLCAFVSIELEFKARPGLANAIANWCATHGHQLLIAALFDLHGFDDTWEQVNRVVKFFRNHTAPRHILSELSPTKGFVRHCETRMASKVLVERRFKDLGLSGKSTQAVAPQKWAELGAGKTGAEKRELAEIKALVLSADLLARVEKKLELLDFYLAQLRRVDSDGPTMGILYQIWLENEAHARQWHATRFAAGEADGFQRGGPNAVTLLTLGTREDSGRDSDHQWSAEEVVSFRWKKMYDAGSGMGGKLTALAHVVNPCFHADQSSRSPEVLADSYEVLKYMRGQQQAQKIWGQLVAYQDTPATHGMFVEDGVRHRACDYSHPDGKGLEGRDWWYKLPPPQCFDWKDLKQVALEVLSQTATESPAERHYSELDLTQHEKRAKMDPKKAGRLTFIKSEIHETIATRSNNFETPKDLEIFDAVDGLGPPPPRGPPPSSPPPSSPPPSSPPPSSPPTPVIGDGDVAAVDRDTAPTFCKVCKRRNDVMNVSSTHRNSAMGDEAICQCPT